MKTGFITGGAPVCASLLAITLALAACTSVTALVEPASVDGCRTETRRELRYAGPPGKFPPTPFNRQVRVCNPAAAGLATNR